MSTLHTDIITFITKREPNPHAWMPRLRMLADALELNTARIAWLVPQFDIAVYAMLRETKLQGKTEEQIRAAMHGDRSEEELEWDDAAIVRVREMLEEMSVAVGAPGGDAFYEKLIDDLGEFRHDWAAQHGKAVR